MLLRPHPRERGELLAKRRAHAQVCPACTSLVMPEEASCVECGHARPEPGWTPREEQRHALLGHTLLDRYLVTGFIASGAHAQVYRVWSLHLPRTFAVKVIDLDDFQRREHDELIVRLQREIDALARLNNPHIVKLHDVLQLSQRAVGLVMEFIDGQPLSALIERQGPLEPLRALRLVRQLALAIQPLHRMEQVHRDIKPENVMVSELAAQMEFVHLLDFGLVSGKHRVTTDFIGTPAHASPEICAGGLDVDVRSDIYSLGSVLFTMLTGKMPFAGSSIFEIIYKKVSTKAPRVSASVWVPEDLDELVAALLARQKERRPPTVEALIERIDALLDALRSRSAARSDAMLGPDTQPHLSGASATMPKPNLKPNPNPSTAGPTPSPQALPSCVIVADTDPESARRVMALDRSRVMRCLMAPHASILLEMCAQEDPELVLMALDLPHAHELDLFKLLRARTQARIILMVAADSPPQLLDAFELAGVDFVLKPLSEPLLRERLMRRGRMTSQEFRALERLKDTVPGP